MNKRDNILSINYEFNLAQKTLKLIPDTSATVNNRVVNDTYKKYGRYSI